MSPYHLLWHQVLGGSQPFCNLYKGMRLISTISYHDFLTFGGEQGAKDAGKMRQEGRDYVVQDGDVILFRFNV